MLYSMSLEEIGRRLGHAVVLLKPGQLATHDGAYLNESQYIATSESDHDDALEKLFAQINLYGEEVVYTRGATVEKILNRTSDAKTAECFVAEITIAKSPIAWGFDNALKHLKAGKSLKRTGWNGKGQYVYLVENMENFQPFLVLRNAQGLLQPGWLPSMGDLMAVDWTIHIEDEK